MDIWLQLILLRKLLEEEKKEEKRLEEREKLWKIDPTGGRFKFRVKGAILDRLIFEYEESLKDESYDEWRLNYAMLLYYNIVNY